MFVCLFFAKGDGLVTERKGKVGVWETGQGWREKGGEERDKSRKTERAPARYHQVTDDGVWPGEEVEGQGATFGLDAPCSLWLLTGLNEKLSPRSAWRGRFLFSIYSGPIPSGKVPWKAFASAPGPVLFGEQLEMMRGLTCKFSLAAPLTEAGEMHFPSVGPRAGRTRRRPGLAASTRQAGYWVSVLFSSEESAFSNREVGYSNGSWPDLQQH